MLDVDDLMWAGWEQGSVASLTANGLFYECYVWLNKAQFRIETTCKVHHPDGSTSVVFHNYVDTASSTEVVDSAGIPLDCPKIIAVGTVFHVTWLRSDDVEETSRNWALHRAVMDMESFDASIGGWTELSILPIHEPYALYDVCPVIGDDGGNLIIARATAVDEITVGRYTNAGTQVWIDTIDPDIEGRVLGVYAHEDDGDVIVSYERTGVEETPGGALWSWHLDADDGTPAASDVQTFVTYSFVDPHGPFTNSPVLSVTGAFYVNVKHVRVGTGVIAVFAESVLIDLAQNEAPYSFVHHVSYRVIESGDASRVGNEHWCPHLSLVSQPWAYDNGSTAAGGGPNLYAVVSYKSIYPTNDWAQASIFAVNFNYQLWQTIDSGQMLRPRPIATLTSVGIPDARVSGWHPEGEDFILGGGSGLTGGPIKRCNHLSNVADAPPFGPLVKTKTVAVGIWAQMGVAATDPLTIDDDQSATVVLDDEAAIARGGEFAPENAGITGFRVYMEDPGAIYRDASDPPQPVDNFVGAYPRAMFQSVEIGRSLVTLGGTPYVYDGERSGELGFPWGPEIFRADSLEAGENQHGALTPELTYRYYAVFTRRDAAGQYHRSPPSRICSITLGASDNLVVLQIRTQTLSVWDNRAIYPSSPDVEIEIFRTEGDGGIFFRLFGARRLFGVGVVNGGQMRARDTPTNNPLAIWGYSFFFDGLADAELRLQGAAPFTLGPNGFVEIAPQVVPALKCPTVWQSRLWGADMLDPSVLWYSDQVLPEFASDYYRAPEFNDVNTFRIDGLGEVVALQAMASNLIVFTRSAIYAIQGNGNDGTGQGADYTLEVIDRGTGCIDPRSVVLAPAGIFFQSWKGYYLLDRGLALDYLTSGASIEDDIREAGNIAAATLMETKNQIRLVCNGRPVTTYTTTWTVGGAFLSAGTWSITVSGFGVIASHASVLGASNESVATALAADIQALIDDRSLRHFVASVEADGDDLIVVWMPDVVPAYSDAQPSGATFAAVDTSDLQVRPRVLLFDYLQRRWARWELPDVSTSERLNEAVSGCSWGGAEGVECHVVLQQGGLRIERSPRDTLAYTDDSSTGAPLPVRIDVKTSPIHLAGIGGYKRVRRIYVQTTKPNASQYNVDLDYYLSGDYSDPDDVDTDITVITTTPAGEEVCPRIQKIQAIGVRIHEPVGVTNRENIEVHSITLLAGVKKGIAKHSDSQRGTT